MTAGKKTLGPHIAQPAKGALGGLRSVDECALRAVGEEECIVFRGGVGLGAHAGEAHG